jgi:hypothetical protein
VFFSAYQKMDKSSNSNWDTRSPDNYYLWGGADFSSC